MLRKTSVSEELMSCLYIGGLSTAKMSILPKLIDLIQIFSKPSMIFFFLSWLPCSKWSFRPRISFKCQAQPNPQLWQFQARYRTQVSALFKKKFGHRGSSKTQKDFFGFLVAIDKMILQFLWKYKGTRVAQF